MVQYINSINKYYLRKLPCPDIDHTGANERIPNKTNKNPFFHVLYIPVE
jgi:hypothetical protein